MANKTLSQWFSEQEIQDLFETAKKAVSIPALHSETYKSMAEAGRKQYDLQNEINSYTQIMSDLGFGRPEVTKEANGSFRIIYNPTDPNSDLSESDAPYLKISIASDGGIIINNTLPTVELPVFVKGANGGVSIAPSMAVGLHSAVAQLRGTRDRLLASNARGSRELASSIRSTTKKQMTGVTHNNPAIVSTTASEAYRNALGYGQSRGVRPELVAAMESQVLSAFYYEQLYKEHEHNVGKTEPGAPRDNVAFHQMLNEIFHEAHSYRDVQSLGAHVKSRYPWVYKHLWANGLENFYTDAYAIGITRGIKKEGASGVVSFGRHMTPGSVLAPGSSNKDAKNLRILQKAASQATHKSGINNEFTADQLTEYKKIPGYLQSRKHVHGVYNVGFVSDASLMQAADELAKEYGHDLPMQELLDVMKGVTQDGSVYARSIADDFKVEYEEKKKVARSTIDKEVRARAEQYLKKNKEEKRSVDELLSDKALRDRWTRGALSKEFRLNSRDKLVDYALDEETGKYEADLTRYWDNPTFTARAGGTGDIRTVVSEMSDELLQRAFEIEGYKEEQAKQLKIGIHGGKLEAKNAWTYLNMIRTYIVSELRKKAQVGTPGLKGSALEEQVLKEMDGSILRDFYSGVSQEAGSLIFDNDAYRAIVEKTKDKTVGVLKEILDFGHKKGILPYSSSDYFDIDANGNISFKKPMIMATEFGPASVERYQGQFDDDGAGMKVGPYELESLRGTLGRMRLAFSGQEGKNDALNSFTQFVSKLEAEVDRLQEAKFGKDKNNQEVVIRAAYQSYLDNLGRLKDTFNAPAVEGIREELDKYGILVDADALRGLSTDIDFSAGDAIKSKNNQELAIEYLRKRQDERYGELLKSYSKEELSRRGIRNAADIQVGLNLKNRRAKNGNQLAGVVMLGTSGLDVYNPDNDGRYGFTDIDVNNNALIREFLKFDGSAYTDEHAAERFGQRIIEAYDDINKDVLKGSIFKNSHQLKLGGPTGYLLMQPMNTHFADSAQAETFKKQLFGSAYKEGMELPSFVMSRKDAASILRRGSIADLVDTYVGLYGKNAASELKDAGSVGADFKKRQELINAILDGMTLGNANFQGFSTSGMLWRSPTLTMFDDMIGGTLALSHGNIKSGNILVNPDAARTFHGDFDGDRIAFFNAIVEGDYNAAGAALESYFAKQTGAQKERRIREDGDGGYKESGEIAEINSVFDKEAQGDKTSAVNVGAKGAGIFGDLLYGIEGALKQAGLTYGGITSPNVEIGGYTAGEMASAFAGHLYQEGVNPKNTNVNGENAGAVMDDLIYRANQGATWGSYDALYSYLEALDEAGILGKTGVFKKDAAAKHFGEGVLNDKQYEYYATMAKQLAEKGRRGDIDLSDTQIAALLQESDLFKQKGARNISKELLAYIITSGDAGGLNQFLGLAGLRDKTIANIVAHKYKYNLNRGPGSGGMVPYAVSGELDEESQKQMIAWGKNLDQFTKGLDERQRALAASGQSTLQDFADTSYLQVYRDIVSWDGRGRLGSPHSVNTETLGAYKGEPNSYAALQGVLGKLREADEKGILGTDNNTWKDFVTPSKAQDFATSFMATTVGSLIHKYHEIMVNAFGEAARKKLSDPTVKDPEMGELDRLFSENEDVRKYVEELDLYWKSQGDKDWETKSKKTTRQVLARAHAQAKSTLEHVGNGGFAGAEIILPGLLGDSRTTGVMDAGYLDKNNNFVVTDLKNTRTGQATINDFLQAAQYGAFLQAWKYDIAQQGGRSASAYFNSSGSQFVKLIKDSVSYMAGQRADREAREYTDAEINARRGKLSEEDQKKYTDDDIRELLHKELVKTYTKEELEKFTRQGGLYDQIRAAESVLLRIQDTSSEGFVRQFEMNSSNVHVREALGKIRAGAQITKEEGDIIMALAAKEGEMSRINEIIDTAGPRSAYLKAQQAFNTYKEQEYELDSLIRVQEILGNETQVTKLRAQQEALRLKAEDEKFQKQTDVEGTKKAYEEALKASSGGDTDIINAEQDETNRLLQRLNQETFAERGKFFASDFLPEYAKVGEKYASLRSQSRGIRTRLKDPYLSAENRDTLQQQQLDIRHQLAEVVKQLEALGEAARQATVGSEEMSKAFQKAEDSVDKHASTQEKAAAKEAKQLNTRMGRRERMGIQRQFESAFNGINGSYLKEEELRQRIAKETDPNKRSYLLMELDDQLEYGELMKEMAEETFGQYRNKKGVMSAPVQALFDQAKKNSDLRMSIRLNEFLARKSGGGNNMGGWGFPGLTDQFGAYFQRLASGGMVYNIIGKLRSEMSKLIQKAQELDKVMTNVRIVTNDSIKDTRSLMTEYSNLGKELGVTTTEIAKSGVEWMRQGYAASEAGKLIKASMYLSKLGMIDSTTATKDLTSAMKGFKLEAADAMSIVDKLTSIDLKAATSAGDIAEGLAQFANLGSLSGVNIDQAAAYVATIADVTQMTGSSAGQALKTIISRYGNVKAGAYNKLNVDAESSDTSENLNDVEKVLNKIGISIRSTNLEFKDFDEVLSEIADRWESLDNVSKKAISNAFAGIRQQESFVTLLENWSKYQELLDTSRNSKGTAEQKYQSYRDSLEAAQNKLTATIENFTNQAEISTFLKVLTDIRTVLAESLPALMRWAPKFLVLAQELQIFSGNSLVQKALGSKFVQNSWSRIKSNFADSIAAAELSGPDGARARGIARGIRKTILGGETKAEMDDRLALEKKLTEETQKRVDASKLETINKEKVAMAANTESQKKATVATQAQLEKLASEKKLTNAQLEEMVSNKQLTAEQAINLYRLSGKKSENQVEKLRQLGANAEAKEASKGASGDTPKIGASGQGAMAAASYAIGQLTSAVSSYQITGLTHEYNGETVQSSEQAHETARAWSTGISAVIPFFGGMLGEMIGNAVAEAIDRDRDAVNVQSAKAQSSLDALSATKDDISTLVRYASGESEEDYAQRTEAIENYLSSMYSEENTDLRLMLQDYLGDIVEKQVTLNDLMEDYRTSDAKSRERIARQLEIATKKAELTQQRQARQDDIMNRQRAVSDKYLAYNSRQSGYTGQGISVGDEFLADATGLYAGLGTTVGVTLGSSAVAGAVAGSAAGPIGTVAGLIIGAITGVITGVATHNAMVESAKEKERQWDNKTTIEKIDQLRDEEKNIREAINKADSNNVGALQEQLAATQDLRASLEDYNAWISQQIASDNKMAVEEALLEAKDANGQYLMDMTQAQLEGLGPTQIYKILGDVLNNNASLSGGMRVYTTDKQFTSEFIQMATDILKSDPEIAAALTQKDKTLRDAVATLNKDDYFEGQILENFATALHTSVESLSEFVEKFGELTLADLLKGTTELTETVSSYTTLLSSVSDGTKSISEWMNTIITQFPDLLQYMGDVPVLMQHITMKVRELSQRYVESQWEELGTSRQYYTDVIQADILNQFTEGEDRDAIKKLLESTGAGNMNGLRTWFKGQDLSDPDSLQSRLYEAFKKAGSETTLISDIYKEQLRSYMETNVKAMEKQISNLEAQKQALMEINHQREYENKLIEARNKLEDAQNEKKRVFRAGVGWVYEADQKQIEEAQSRLEDVENERKVAEIEEQISTLTAQKDEWSNVWEKQNYELAQEQAKAFETEFGAEGTLNQQLDKIIGPEGLLQGIRNSVDAVTSAILGQDMADREKMIGEGGTLDTLWEELMNASDNADEHNDKLNAFSAAYQQAVGAGYNVTGWAQRQATSSGKSVEEIKEYGANPGKFRTNPTVSVTPTYDNDDKLGGLRAPEVTVGNAEYATGSDKAHIWQDMENAAKEDKSKKALIWEVKSDGTLDEGHGFGKQDQRLKGLGPEEFENLDEYAEKLNGQKVHKALIAGLDGDDEWAYLANGNVFSATHAATGSLGLPGNGLALINELGTEALVTPQGTLTALPARTGVVPADITKSLWELGELAPAIMQALQVRTLPDSLGANNMSELVHDESFNIDSIVMNVSADGTFDADSFVQSLKDRIALTRNGH